MKVRLTKLSTNQNALRSNAIEGELVYGPTIEKSLIIMTDPIDASKDYRQVATSMLQEIKVLEPRVYELKTLNSTYKLELL